jgi:hypothetical protein
MRATVTFRAPRPADRLAGEAQRAFLACGFVLVVCAFAVGVANRSQALLSPVSLSPVSRSHTSGETDLSTGSLLFVQPTGTFCRERTIDNSTWQIRDKGWVDCAEAMVKSTNSGAEVRSAGSRLDIIRESFLRKP